MTTAGRERPRTRMALMAVMAIMAIMAIIMGP